MMRSQFSARERATAIGTLAVMLLSLCCFREVLAADTSTRLSLGKEVFDRKCTACHGEGPDKSGTVALAVRDGASQSPLIEKRTNLSREVIVYFVRNGVSVMPPYRKTELSDRELDQLVDYLVNK